MNRERVTPEELAEVHARDKAATPGEWRAYGFRVCSGKVCVARVGCLADRLFMRAARTLLPKFAREIERLMAERDAWKSLAKARGLRLFGQWSVAPELAAEDRLRALGITPEEP
jgi:hypothetical protein